MRSTLIILWTACVWAQSGLDVPVAGAMVDLAGKLRPVQGVAGNFWLGAATVSGVLSASCSGRLCLAKTDSKILSATGETDAPSGPAIFSVGADDAIAYFPETRTFARWHNDTLNPLDWMVDGEVLSIRASEIAVQRNDGVWIVRPDGVEVDWVAETGGPVLLLADGVLFATPDEVVLRRSDASELRFPLTGAESITAMGTYYAAIRVGDSTYALRTEGGREQLFLLPGDSP
jgi:hypothetical protein